MPTLNDLIQKEKTPEDQNIYFDTIPLIKVIIMSIITFNFYLFAWSNQMWSKLSDKGYDISPFWRCLYFPLTNFALFSIIGKYLKKAANIEIGGVFCALSCIIIYHFSLNHLGNYFEIAIPNSFAAFILTFAAANFLSMLPIVYIQSRINKANKTYCGGGYVDGFHKGDLVFVILCYLALAVFALYIMGSQRIYY